MKITIAQINNITVIDPSTITIKNNSVSFPVPLNKHYIAASQGGTDAVSCRIEHNGITVKYFVFPVVDEQCKPSSGQLQDKDIIDDSIATAWYDDYFLTMVEIFYVRTNDEK